jgi:hypothetical protein
VLTPALLLGSIIVAQDKEPSRLAHCRIFLASGRAARYGLLLNPHINYDFFPLAEGAAVTARMALPRRRKTTCLAPPPAQLKDRREAPRYRCRWRCYCSPIVITRQVPPWSGTVKDISVGGIQLEFGHPVPPGTFLAVHLQSTPGQFIPQLRARVIRSTRTERGMHWTIGCALNPALSTKDLDLLL